MFDPLFALHNHVLTYFPAVPPYAAGFNATTYTPTFSNMPGAPSTFSQIPMGQGSAWAQGTMVPPQHQGYMPALPAYGASSMTAPSYPPMPPANPLPPTQMNLYSLGALRPPPPARHSPTSDDISNTESVAGGVSLDPAVYNQPRNRWASTRGMARSLRGSRQ